MTARLTASRILELAQLSKHEPETHEQVDVEQEEEKQEKEEEEEDDEKLEEEAQQAATLHTDTLTASNSKITARSLNTFKQLPQSDIETKNATTTKWDAAEWTRTDDVPFQTADQEAHSQSTRGTKSGAASAAEPESNLAKKPKSVTLGDKKVTTNAQPEEQMPVPSNDPPTKPQRKNINDLIVQINQALNDPSAMPTHSSQHQQPKKVPSKPSTHSEKPPPTIPQPPPYSASDRSQALRKMERIVGDWFSAFSQDEVAERLKGLGTPSLNVAFLVSIMNDAIINQRGSLVRTAKLVVCLLKSNSILVPDVFDSLKEVIQGFKYIADMAPNTFRNFGTLYGVLMVSDEISFDLGLLQELLEKYIQEGYKGEPVVLHVLGQVFDVVRIMEPQLSLDQFFEEREIRLRLRAFWPAGASESRILTWLEDHFLEHLATSL
ncbi:hypothetical protein BJ741DRAFT_383004 [Chytriomyces cf. hyalinus JEL632]|nr:hypothetical protein BJ741DRAFT_383004 [Chytriomyces cf. hyalinus JEL632]